MASISEALRNFHATLDNVGIDCRSVEVSLPVDQWKLLDRALVEEAGAG